MGGKKWWRSLWWKSALCCVAVLRRLKRGAKNNKTKIKTNLTPLHETQTAFPGHKDVKMLSFSNKTGFFYTSFENLKIPSKVVLTVLDSPPASELSFT